MRWQRKRLTEEEARSAFERAKGDHSEEEVAEAIEHGFRLGFNDYLWVKKLRHAHKEYERFLEPVERSRGQGNRIALLDREGAGKRLEIL